MISEANNVLSVGNWGTSQESLDQEEGIITKMTKITDTKDPTTIKENLEESDITSPSV